MIVIADSGSTKTLWCFVSRNMGITKVHTSGMNPNFITKTDYNIINQTLLPYITNFDPIENVYFYGAGCGTQNGKDKIKQLLQKTFANAYISVETDMLGACIGSCGNASGIVGILGTGSNSCLYNNGTIIQNIPALGYTLCDEGSGNHIGKLLLKTYLRGFMPSDLCCDFKNKYPYDTSYFLDHLYNQPFPNRFLASFAPFAFEHRQHPFMGQLLHKVFQSFFEEQIICYDGYNDYKLHLVGSVAYCFENEIAKVAKEYGITIASIKQSPIDGLISLLSRPCLPLFI